MSIGELLLYILFYWLLMYQGGNNYGKMLQLIFTEQLTAVFYFYSLYFFANVHNVVVKQFEFLATLKCICF